MRPVSTRSIVSVLALCALGLSACGAPPVGAEAGAPEPQLLAGVDLTQPVRALGTEPFWAVEVTPEHLVLTGVDREEEKGLNPGAVLQGTMALFNGQTEDQRKFRLALIATDCSDGMSDRIYPLTARVEIGDQVLQGCAASAEALERVGEAGRVE